MQLNGASGCFFDNNLAAANSSMQVAIVIVTACWPQKTPHKRCDEEEKCRRAANCTCQVAGVGRKIFLPFGLDVNGHVDIASAGVAMRQSPISPTRVTVVFHQVPQGIPSRATAYKPMSNATTCVNSDVGWNSLPAARSNAQSGSPIRPNSTPTPLSEAFLARRPAPMKIAAMWQAQSKSYHCPCAR